MWPEAVEARWRELSEEVFVGMKEWRIQHPKATFREIETALDERLGRVRARMLQDAALATAAADVSGRDGEWPTCPTCGGRLERRGAETRDLTVQHEQTVRLTRRYAECPACGAGLFPLDEELELAPGSLAPSLFEGAVRLGTWIPFPRLAAELQYFTRTWVSEPTLRRATEKAGEAYVAVQTKQVDEIERDPSEESPPGPPRQQLSVDGAMVPLRGKGEWAEVKTLALGTIQPAVLNKKGESEIHTTELSYFSRLADHETFARLATVETHRRGTVRAGRVGAVVDGAEWEQKFVDLHRPDAVRILDWGHAAEYVAKVGQAVFGAGTAAASEWLGIHLHALKHGDPATVLGVLRDMRDRLATSESEGSKGPVVAVLTASIDYLEKRREQIRYAEFQAQGYPIGSGIVESANKLVVEARLKGAGMHWAREHVNPMVALRTIACSDRWEEAWPQISRRLREAQRERTAQRRAKRRAEQAQTTVPSAEAKMPDRPTKKPHDADLTLPTTPAVASPSQHQVKTPHRPAPDHPWRHQRIGRGQTQQTRLLAGAKS